MRLFATTIFASTMTVLLFAAAASAAAFVAKATNAPASKPNSASKPKQSTSTRLRMIGGRGWDSDGYLSGLSGDDDDRRRSREEYERFREDREAFRVRQEAIAKTPEGAAFLERRAQRQEQEQQQRDDDPGAAAGFGAVPPQPPPTEGPGGATKFGRMMSRASAVRGRRPGGIGGVGGVGFDSPKLLGPLDDDEEEAGVE